MMHPPQRTVTFDELKANFDVGGLARRLEDMKAELTHAKKETDRER